jgi:hypothetical protein
MLKKTYVRNGKSQIIGSVTTGFEGAFDAVVRDEHEHVLGRTSETFQTTRDSHGNVISLNTADPGLLFNRQK